VLYEGASEGDEIRLLLSGQIWCPAYRRAFSQFDQHLRAAPALAS
jgi:hypothetical protein